MRKKILRTYKEVDTRSPHTIESCFSVISRCISLSMFCQMVKRTIERSGFCNWQNHNCSFSFVTIIMKCSCLLKRKLHRPFRINFKESRTLGIHFNATMLNVERWFMELEKGTKGFGFEVTGSKGKNICLSLQANLSSMQPKEQRKSCQQSSNVEKKIYYACETKTTLYT